MKGLQVLIPYFYANSLCPNFWPLATIFFVFMEMGLFQTGTFFLMYCRSVGLFTTVMTLCYTTIVRLLLNILKYINYHDWVLFTISGRI